MGISELNLNITHFNLGESKKESRDYIASREGTRLQILSRHFFKPLRLGWRDD